MLKIHGRAVNRREPECGAVEEMQQKTSLKQAEMYAKCTVSKADPDAYLLFR